MSAEPLMPSLRNPLDPARRIHAVLFDVDGTLYRQRPLQALMAVELLVRPMLSNPFRAPRQWQALREYRRAQERLRTQGAQSGSSIGQRQMIEAGQRAKISLPEVEALVDEWMFRRPLKYLPHVRARGLRSFFEWLTRSGVRTGVLSDYPAASKLQALGLDHRFSLVLAASDPDIDALKPHPRGFLRACEQWHLRPSDVLMVGDRPDVDAAGAAAAGMPCVIVGRAETTAARGYLQLPSFERLRRALDLRS